MVETTVIRLILNFSASHFSNLPVSSSPYTAAERMSVPVPRTRLDAMFTTPRTKGMDDAFFTEGETLRRFAST